MAIKVDLEKAYGRFWWGFLAETLHLNGLPEELVTLIMHCVTLVNMKVLGNGKTSDAFQPKRGLRQGDPPSPYLFVLCMERLAFLIRDGVEAGALAPFSISRQGPHLLHLLFADDLIFFVESTPRQMEVI